MTELFSGLSIGLAAGISPGPLQALIVTSSLDRGFGAGWRVAIAPLLTDAPIIAASILFAGFVPAGWLDWLAVAGGIAVVAVGLWELRRPAVPAPAGAAPVAAGGTDLWRGVMINALSPHPWLFWLTVGGPVVVAGWRDAPWRGMAFLAGFYVTLIGSKVGLAWVLARGGARLGPRRRRHLLVAGGFLLITGGLIVLIQALRGEFGGG